MTRVISRTLWDQPMKRILVTGAAGQIGQDLVPALRERYGSETVVAAGHRTPLPDATIRNGPTTVVDVTDYGQIVDTIRKYEIGTIHHLSTILSALAEQERQRGHEVNINGLYNVLEAAHACGVERVIAPSSIAAFGPETPRDPTPNDTIQKPNTLYGIAKVFGELLGNYYSTKVGLDVRGLRLPGIVSCMDQEPTAGTTDYAVLIFFGAIREQRYTCFLAPETRLPMMYMPDAVKAIIDLAEADFLQLGHHADFNVAAMSFTPAELAAAIRKRIPEFEMDYEIDPLRQAIADSWPRSLDDSAARREWGWNPEYDIDGMVDDMLDKMRRKLQAAGQQSVIPRAQ